MYPIGSFPGQMKEEIKLYIWPLKERRLCIVYLGRGFIYSKSLYFS